MEMNLVYERAWSFHRTTGLDFEELVAHATEAYLKAERVFKSNKAKKTTFIYEVITNSLTDYCRDEAKQIKSVPIIDDIFPDHSHFLNHLSKDINFTMDSGRFPDNVKELINIIFKHEEEFNIAFPRKSRMHLLYLLEFNYGWGQRKRKQTIAELKRILRETAENDLFT